MDVPGRVPRWLFVVALLLILLVAAGLRLYRLPDLPLGLHYDEAANVILAGEIARGLNLPVFIFPRHFGMCQTDLQFTSKEDILKIAGTYHNWRGDGEGKYKDVPGYCKSAKLEDIQQHNHVLTPGRYVGAAEAEDDDEPFEVKMPRLVAKLNEQFEESAKLEKAIKQNLKRLGYA